MEKNKIWLSSPHMGGEEKKFVDEAFATNWIAPIGPNLDGFETDINNYLGSDVQTAGLTSGTSAIHLALITLGVSKGDIVLVQSFTFCGSSNPVNYVGAESVFIDSERDTWNMCPQALEDALKIYGKKVKAIIPVHLYGMPYQVEEITRLSNKYRVPIIEDAAEALGSSYSDQRCGTFGDISVLSFNGNKIITTSGGGAFVSKNVSYVNQAKFLSTQARDTAPHYQHSSIGFNYRMSNIVAGIGRGQMEVLHERVDQRRRNNIRYREFFKNVESISFQNEPDKNYFSNYWLTSILIDQDSLNGISNEVIRKHLDSENIESRPLWKPMHLQPVHHKSKFIGNGECEILFKQGICLPSGSNLTDVEFERIFTAINNLFVQHGIKI